MSAWIRSYAIRRVRLVNFHNFVDETIDIREGGHLGGEARGEKPGARIGGRGAPERGVRCPAFPGRGGRTLSVLRDTAEPDDRCGRDELQFRVRDHERVAAEQGKDLSRFMAGNDTRIRG